VFLILGTLLMTAVTVQGDGTDTNWPSFRGPQATGVAEGYATPTSWDVPSGENILWRTPIPGLGHSCPVVWGDRLFVTTAISGEDDPMLKVGLYGDITPVEDDSEHTWKVFALDKRTGELVWDQVVFRGVPKVKRHMKSTHANSTPATDGKHLVVMFGSEGLYCYSLDGRLLWKKDLGTLDSAFYRAKTAQWAFGSSPVIHDGRVIIQADVIGDSFLAAFAVEDGKELWRTPREDVPSWGTPTVHAGSDRVQVLVNGYRHMGGYDLATGKELWRLAGGGDIPVPTPVVGQGLVYFASAHGGPAPVFAVGLGAKDDVSLVYPQTANDFVAWSDNGAGAYMQTPLLYGDYLYVCTDSSILKCYDAKTGEQVYKRRIARSNGGMTASPVAADGKLYFTSEDGTVHVVQAGAEFSVLARNDLDEITMATPAISAGVLYFRTRGHVVAVGGASNEASPPSAP